ncbi:TPA: lytic transglycosylase catalytic [Morganella morganii]|uniref:lytic transglycosylase catalytic n=1 Tax=Morganella morganii TaxID=582 RepID=UPI001A310E54|nr:lytic transglycosylase catalytic [Morganella morganii]MCU6210208.1 lytic transglycosylase catalytic [Morganella morganii]HAT1514541.1 lytic transglycosylase catalytic [Morganella morganii]
MSSAETLRDFLVSLGFDVDESGAKKFSSVLGDVTSKAMKAGAAIEAAALTIVGFTAKISDGLDKLYWQSQRTGATANNIRSLGYAVKQAGGDVNGFSQSVERLASFLRNNPGGEGFLRNMGIQTRDANGRLRDTASLVALLGDRLAKMPVYRANQYAGMLGIDENTLMAMRRGIHGYSSEYTLMMKAMGFNPDAAAKQGSAFMTQFSKMKAAMGIGRDKIGAELARVLTPGIERFTKLLIQNFPLIEKFILKVTGAILKLSDILEHFVYRSVKGIRDLTGWWDRLDESTKGMIKTFGLVLAAWWALNKGFLTSPVGLMITALTALFLLWDDYETWKEGGKSAIDWSQWTGTIESVKKTFKEVWGYIQGIITSVGGWETIFWGFALFLGGKWLFSILATVTRAGGALALLAGWPGLIIAGMGALLIYHQKLLDQIDFGRMGEMTGELAGNIGRLKKAVEEYQATDSLTTKAGIVLEKAGGIIPVPFASQIGAFMRTGTVDTALQKLGFGSAGGADYSTLDGAARGIRNNNPLNMNFAKQNGARKESSGAFAVYNTAYEGIRGNARQLMMYFNGTSAAADGKKLQTISEIVSLWAPKKHGKNDPVAYAKRVADEMKIDVNDRLNLDDPEVMYALIRAMSMVENNGQFPYPKELVTAAITGAPDPTITGGTGSGVPGGGGIMETVVTVFNDMKNKTSFMPQQLLRNDRSDTKSVSFHQVNNISVTGVSDPQEAAGLSGDAVGRNNQILVRNLESKVS